MTTERQIWEDADVSLEQTSSARNPEKSETDGEGVALPECNLQNPADAAEECIAEESDEVKLLDSEAGAISEEPYCFWKIYKNSFRVTVPLLLLLLAVATVVYYILFPARGEFHSDCTDTIYWAKASYDSGKILSPDFYYACLLPFGGSLLMLIFIPFFGVSMTTHTLGMLLFFVLFLTAFCLMLKEMHWNFRWICIAAAVLLTVVSSSQKLREIFWGHTIYYSLGILFLFFGLFLLFRLQNLLEQQKDKRKENQNGTSVLVRICVTLAVLLLFFLLCCTDQVTAITIFALPVLAGLFLERFLDRNIPLVSWENSVTLLLILALGVMVLCGMKLGAFWAGDLTGIYADAYSGYAPQSSWLEHAQTFPLAWLTLLGLEDIPDTPLMHPDSVRNLIRMAVAILLLVLPIIATCCYSKYEGRSGRQMRILLWAHWVMTALIMVGYICGYLSAANWRLSPIVCTSTVVSVVFVHWAIVNRTTMGRISGALCIPIVCFCVLSAWNVAKLPVDYYKQNIQYQLAEMLQNEGLTYGYATFWNANAMTVLSNSELVVRSIEIDENGLHQALYQTEPSWYEAQPDQENYFLLLDRSEYAMLKGQMDSLLTEAQRSFVLSGSDGTLYQVLVFSENIWNQSQNAASAVIS